VSDVSRRSFLKRTATVSGSAAILAVGPAQHALATGDPSDAAPTFGPVTVTPDDARYPDLVWGTNQRWVGTPDYVTVVGSAEQVRQAVQEAVQAGKGVAVRSGGHCYEDFVSNSGVRAVIDMSGLAGIGYDPGRRAFWVEPGARLLDVYRTLYKGWGVTLPGGSCPSVGVGGHIVGGGYGALSRLHGLTVDHLYGVELVVVDDSGTARTLTATREPSDPNRELWWAHTGGGGGNFGVITRYWLRSPDTDSTDPSALLPKPPSEVIVSSVSWPWERMTQQSFSTLLRNFGAWYERNSADGSPYASLFSQLKPTHRSAGAFSMTTQIDASAPNAGKLVDDYLAEVNAGVGVDYQVDDRRTLPWLHAATQYPGFTATDTSTRFKAKSAYMRRGFPDDQIAAFWKHLNRDDFIGPASLVMITAYGGRINTVSPSATVVPQRDSVLKLHYVSFWTDPADDPAHLSWIREFYQDVYSATGGVPAPTDVTDGCFVNYADVDLGDPVRNTSGVPWHDLYYKDNYRRLQAVKAAWDPRNVFHHQQSVRLPAS
jgi:FAD/FMN-containing dehydrogenase